MVKKEDLENTKAMKKAIFNFIESLKLDNESKKAFIKKMIKNIDEVIK